MSIDSTPCHPYNVIKFGNILAKEIAKKNEDHHEAHITYVPRFVCDLSRRHSRRNLKYADMVWMKYAILSTKQLFFSNMKLSVLPSIRQLGINLFDSL